MVGAFLAALKIKGETADELAGAVAAVRERSTGWDFDPSSPSDARHLRDRAAMGRTRSTSRRPRPSSWRLAGSPVAKHGNRSASGNSGSAEVLTELGVDVEASPATLRRCLDELGLTFLFAPRFHPALRFLAPIRKQLPFRTMFNLIGPLANPARPAYQLIGVPSLILVDQGGQGPRQARGRPGGGRERLRWA